jgi:hypothetical protein
MAQFMGQTPRRDPFVDPRRQTVAPAQTPTPAAPPDARGALLAMLRGGGSNMTGRSGDEMRVMSGEADFEPSEIELQDMQEGDIERGRAHGGAFAVRSRDAHREGAMSMLRRKLGLDAIQHGQALERVERPMHIKGQYDVAAEEAGARAAADRLAYTQEHISARQDQQHQAVMDRLQITQGGMNTRQEDQQQHQVDNPRAQAARVPTQGTLLALQKAREAMPGNPLTKWMNGKAANQNLQSALANVLEQRGTRAAVDAMARDAKAGVEFDPEELAWLQSLGSDEQEYFRLQTGQ